MFCLKPDVPPLNVWFFAAQHNAVSFIKENVKYFKNKKDKRTHADDVYAHKDFCAIHYAILSGNLEIVKTLIEYEYWEQIPESMIMETLKVTPNKYQEYPVSQGTNILQFAIQFSTDEIIEYILRYSPPLQKNQKVEQNLCSTQDAYGGMAINDLFNIRTTKFVLKILDTKFMRKEIEYRDQERPNAMHQLCLYKRGSILEKLFEMAHKHSQLMKRLLYYTLLIFGQSMTCIEYLKCEAGCLSEVSNEYERGLACDYYYKFLELAIEKYDQNKFSMDEMKNLQSKWWQLESLCKLRQQIDRGKRMNQTTDLMRQSDSYVIVDESAIKPLGKKGSKTKQK